MAQRRERCAVMGALIMLAGCAEEAPAVAPRLGDARTVPGAVELSTPGSKWAQIESWARGRFDTQHSMLTYHAVFFGDFVGDEAEDAAAFLYVIEGGQVRPRLYVALFQNEAGAYRFIQLVEDLAGEAPRSPAFGDGSVTVTIDVSAPGSPSATERLRIELD
jgi:hypothetical protein